MSDDRRSSELVLVVDDSRDELAMLVDTLEQAGFTALAATNGEAALALLEKIVPHLVVMDATMPGLDGFETCRRLKRDARFSQLPVVFMTGLTDTDHVLEGLQAGGVDYVTKPVIMSELLARIRVHIANSRAALGAQVGLDTMGRHLFAADGGGQILWATPQAAALISAIGLGGDPATDEPVQALRGFMASGMRSSAEERAVRLPTTGPRSVAATFLCEAGPGEFLFRLAEMSGDTEASLLQKRFMLTSREAEVLLWIARGKANREISEILLISPRTVNKHLERVFAKLGVENRSSATAVAMRLLAGRS